MSSCLCHIEQFYIEPLQLISFSYCEHDPQVLPIEHLLRSSWNTNKYMQGSDSPNKPFLVEECSKAHLARIKDLMRDDYSWSVIAMIALLSSDADMIGSWGEACHCHPIDPSSSTTLATRRMAMTAKREAKLCPFRCCRAPELAVGQGLYLLCDKMAQQRGRFNEYVSRAPQSKRSELNSSWMMACSKLYGNMDDLLFTGTGTFFFRS